MFVMVWWSMRVSDTHTEKKGNRVKSIYPGEHSLLKTVVTKKPKAFWVIMKSAGGGMIILTRPYISRYDILKGRIIQ